MATRRHKGGAKGPQRHTQKASKSRHTAFGSKLLKKGSRKHLARANIGLAAVARLHGFAPKSKRNTARSLFEHHSPTTQCNNVIGHFKEGSPCWICGLPMKNAQCEHILPILPASVYLALYTKGEKNRNNQLNDILKLEYAWSHSLCNYVKGAMYPLAINSDDLFVVERAPIQNLLSNIWNNDRVDGAEQTAAIHKFYKNLPNFVEQRGPPVMERYTAITGYLNDLSTEKGVPFTRLITLAKISVLPNKFNPKMKHLLKDAEPEEPRHGFPNFSGIAHVEKAMAEKFPEIVDQAHIKGIYKVFLKRKIRDETTIGEIISLWRRKRSTDRPAAIKTGLDVPLLEIKQIMMDLDGVLDGVLDGDADADAGADPAPVEAIAEEDAENENENEANMSSNEEGRENSNAA